ncbi:hypothetical protein [Campylobacter vicugnae]|uniref:hypothetical protein n=1 Tax=Campylobacter vicugnae TaxID=1660076 RepID=UPI00254E2300|nr:hypothetical protein [Campylobacter ovis]MDL0096206.1 hypothetical protein [Campylobacter ovis]
MNAIENLSLAMIAIIIFLPWIGIIRVMTINILWIINTITIILIITLEALDKRKINEE